jgi:hypothetical protein
MTLEGRGSFHSFCAGCRAPMPRYRCKDCMVGPLWCQTCLVERHDQSPLHLVEVRGTLPSDDNFLIKRIIFPDVERVILSADNTSRSWPPRPIRTCTRTFVPHSVTCQHYVSGHPLERHTPHRARSVSMSRRTTLQTAPTHWLVASNSPGSENGGYFRSSSAFPPFKLTGQSNGL